jgi:ABC-type sugar transport system ATPase subunit
MGRIELEGKVTEDAATGLSLPPQQRRLAVVFQDLSLWPHMTVFQNVAFGLENQRNLKLRPEWNDSDGHYAATAACALGVAVKKTAADPQLDWESLLAADKRRLVMPSPAQSRSSAEFV